MSTLADLARVERELREYAVAKSRELGYIVRAMGMADTIAAFIAAQRERDHVAELRAALLSAAAQRERDAVGLSAVLDAYEEQTRALPNQHEIPERGCCSYNWRMAIIRDLRAMLKPAAPSGSQSQANLAPKENGDG